MTELMSSELLDDSEIPKVSVIVTCFNRESHVALTLASVQAADPTGISEIVVVDDCSTDGSVAAIEPSLRPQDRLVLHDVNRGQNAAINTAMHHVRAPIIAFCDSDDLYTPGFLTQTLAALEDDRLAFVYTRVVNGPAWNLSGCGEFAAVLEQGFLANLGALVVRTDAFRSIGVLGEREVAMDMCQDDRICFELARRYCFDVVPEPLYALKGSDNSVTKNQPALVEGWDRLFEDYGPDIRRLCRPATLARHRVQNLKRAADQDDKRDFVRLLGRYLWETRLARRPLIEVKTLVRGATAVAAIHARSWVAVRVRRLAVRGGRSTG